MPSLFGILFGIILVAAIALWLKSREQRAATGLPRSANARIVYANTGAWSKVEKPLFSRRHGLTGKPDYIVEDKGTMMPVEVKPNRVAPTPRESDVMQLAAYALLIEESFGVFPQSGLLKYRAAVFQIDLTAELRAHLLDLIDAMRHGIGAREVARSHTEPPRCRACGYRAECGQALESF